MAEAELGEAVELQSELGSDLETESESEMDSGMEYDMLDGKNLLKNAGVAGHESNSVHEKTKFALPPKASFLQQFRAMMYRQWLIKKRGRLQTLLEIISPMLMMTLLVIGWSLSEVLHYDAEIYSNNSLPTLEKFLNIFDDPAQFVENCLLGHDSPDNSTSLTDSFQISPPRLAQKLHRSINYEANFVSNQNERIQTFPFPDFINPEDIKDLIKNNTDLQNALSEIASRAGIDPAEFSNFELSSLILECANVNNQALGLIQELFQYNGYLPVPSFDGFVSAHKFLSQALGNGTENEELRKKEREQQRQQQRQEPKLMGMADLMGNLLNLGKLYFAPDGEQVMQLIDHLNHSHTYFNEFYGGVFASEVEGVEAISTNNEHTVWALIVMNELDFDKGKVDYVIRMNYTSVPRTFMNIHRFVRGLAPAYKNYFSSGFLTIQKTINEYIFSSIPSNDFLPYPIVPIWTLPFPTPEYNHNRFYDAIGPLMGLIMCLSTVYPLGMLVKVLVEEKETKTKEIMQIMGLRPLIFTLSWLLTYLVIFSLASLFVTCLLCTTFLHHSDFFLVLLIFLLFSWSLIPFGFVISTFFSKAKLASFIAPFLHFSALMPRYIFFNASSNQALSFKLLFSFLPPTAFTFGVDLIGQYEGSGQGVHWKNIHDDEFSLSTILNVLLIDFFLYFILAWYLEKVIPSEYGPNLPPWFLFTQSFLFGKERSDKWFMYDRKHDSSLKLGNEYSSENSLESMNHALDFEPFDSKSNGAVAAVQITNLQKVYPDGKVAVSGLTLDIFEGQITALLGHNGAGKSTSISMLTGLIKPSDGDAKVWGRSILSDMTSARRVIGICPQQNVLFPHLTVLEHLILFGALKGVKNIHEESMAMISRVGLKDKVDSFPNALSGGMKRKLQVAIAMLGGSRVVFLDEPTSGMDPHARRAMWKLLRSFKKERAIILTTHYMDEADLLCDRIAILKDGRLRCYGSSLFLKGRHGAGYTLTMLKTNPSVSINGSTPPVSSIPYFNEQAVFGLIDTHVSDAKVIRSAAGEVTFRLPLSQKMYFTRLFSDLEQNQHKLGIAGFGISMTSLEDVFFELANEDNMSSPPSTETFTTSTVKAGTNKNKSHTLITNESQNDNPSSFTTDSISNSSEPTLRPPPTEHENEIIDPATSSFQPPVDEIESSNVNTDNHLGYASDHSSEASDFGHGKSEKNTVKLTSINREETLSFKPWIPKFYNESSPLTQPLLKTNEKKSSDGSKKISKKLREKGLGDVEMGESKTNDDETPLDDVFYGIRSFKRSWTEMFRKRYIVGIRDFKGLVNSILLPVSVIAFVLLILTIQINPAGPKMKLDLNLFDPTTSQVKSSLKEMDEIRFSEIPVAGINPSSLLSLQRSFDVIEYGNLKTSYDMSEYLLDSISYNLPRFNALVYNDIIFQQYNFTNLYLTLSHSLNVSNSSFSKRDLPVNTSIFNTSSFNASDFNQSEAQNSIFRVKDSIEEFFLKYHTESGMGLVSPLTILHNTSSDHALPSMIQELSNAYLKSVFKNEEVSLNLHTHPLPISAKEAKRIETVLSMLASLFILIPFCYLSSTFAVFLVKERNVKAKHLQLVSGANIYAYWLATYIWDVLNYLVITLITMIVFYAYHDDAFVSTWNKSLAVFLLLFSFGISVIPLSYCYSFFFDNHANAQVGIAGIHFLSGFITVVASIIMEADDDTRDLNHYLLYIYRIFPPFNFGDGLIKLSAIDLKSKLIGDYQNPFDWHVIGQPLCLMTLESFLFFFLTISIDLDLVFYSCRWLNHQISNFFRSRHPYWIFEDCYYDGMTNEDSAVANERKRVENGEANSDAIIIERLRKVYSFDKNNRFLPKTAVVDLSLAIPKGQCFGFLGVNGAGKSTTLSILTGDIRPTSGNAWINHWSVINELSQVQRHIGYCPQFDPLIDLMTAKEHLRMYARLKGIEKDKIEAVVSETISAVGLQKFSNVCAGNYSGGNKRKLSLAIALVGKPAAVFLDEPSSGMDPHARRSMWKTILDCTSNGSTSVILTTHSMEECEALCSRVGIMCKGRLVCLGSPQDLKSRFGDGYHLELHVKGGRVESVKTFISQRFSGSVLEEEHLGRLRFLLPMKEKWTLSQVFGTIETNQTQLNIDDYSISQCSLEQVFLTFAQSQLQDEAQ